MKLRNKKTGEIVDVESLGHAESLKEKNGYQVTLSWATEYENLSQCKDYHSLAELNEDWEDYKPSEPLIKDEKKLDTVKSFFALLCITKEIYYQSVNNYFYHTDDDGITYGISFDDDNGIDNLCTGLPYTIAELCGEEEE